MPSDFKDSGVTDSFAPDEPSGRSRAKEEIARGPSGSDLLPGQFGDNKRITEGEYRFFGAMLLRALRDYELALDYLQGYSRKGKAEGAFRLYDEVHGWFTERDEGSEGVTFELVCEVLDLNVSAVRTELAKWRNKRIAEGLRVKLQKRFVMSAHVLGVNTKVSSAPSSAPSEYHTRKKFSL